ncbi:MAG: SPOR domain-containing protein [Clostridia bacterium]|nr:SPOR domain-containing protein [Clostridia bacterium]
MPKNKKQRYLQDYIYDNKKVTKLKINRKKPKFFTLFTAFSSFFIIVFFANIFSSLITPGSINLNRGERYFLGKELYAVELVSFDNVAEANEASETYKRQLAAGYVVNDKGTYRVLASAYKTRTNAESVVNNLKQSSIDANIFVLEMPSLYMDLDLESDEKTALKDCFDMFYDTYLKIYDISIKLDKSEISLDQTKVGILALVDECEQVVNNFNSKIAVPKTSQVIYTKIYLNTFLDELTALSQKSQASTTYSGEIKETYFKIIYGYISLLTELAKN